MNNWPEAFATSEHQYHVPGATDQLTPSGRFPFSRPSGTLVGAGVAGPFGTVLARVLLSNNGTTIDVWSRRWKKRA